MDLERASQDFADRYQEITRNPAYMALKTVPRHGCTNTYDHSVRVARFASRFSSLFGVDSASAARVGLLHDFCLVDYHKNDKHIHGGRWYCFYHPEDAVINSEANGYLLTDAEKKAIWSHMFPLSTSVPTSRLGYLLTLSDKIVATQESLYTAVEACERIKFLLGSQYLRAAKVFRRSDEAHRDKML